MSVEATIDGPKSPNARLTSDQTLGISVAR